MWIQIKGQRRRATGGPPQTPVCTGVALAKDVIDGRPEAPVDAIPSGSSNAKTS